MPQNDKKDYVMYNGTIVEVPAEESTTSVGSLLKSVKFVPESRILQATEGKPYTLAFALDFSKNTPQPAPVETT